jgi:tol-pal system protein YbgF
MKLKLITTVLLFCMPFLLIQCATRQDVQTLDFRTRNLDNKLVELDAALTKLEDRSDLAKKQSVDLVQKQQADTGETVERLHADILQTISDIEEINHNLELSRSENSEFHEQVDSRHTESLRKIEALAAQVEKITNELNEIKITRAREAEERARIAAREAEFAKKKTSQSSGVKVIQPEKQKTAKGTTKQQSTEPGIDSYKKAYTLHENKKYKESFRAFLKYIESYPNGSMVPNARFWLADSLYGQNEYELAILEYQKVIDSYPKHDKAAAALLKEGFAFEKLKDNATAKIVYEKLLAEYPDSNQVESARKRLKDL